MPNSVLGVSPWSFHWNRPPMAMARQRMRHLRIDRPEGHVELVGALVVEFAVAGDPEPVPVVMDEVPVELVDDRRAAPQVPVQVGGRIGGLLEADAVARLAGVDRRRSSACRTSPREWPGAVPRCPRCCGSGCRAGPPPCTSSALPRRRGLRRCRGSSASRRRRACRPGPPRSSSANASGSGWRWRWRRASCLPAPCRTSATPLQVNLPWTFCSRAFSLRSSTFWSGSTR